MKIPKRLIPYAALLPLLIFLGFFKLTNPEIWCSAALGEQALQGQNGADASHGWLYNILIYFLLIQSGEGGIILFRMILLLATNLPAIRFLIKKSVPNLMIIAVMLVTICASQQHYWESEVLVSSFFLVCNFVLSTEFVQRGRIRHLVFSIILLLVWTNLSRLAFWGALIPLALFLERPKPSRKVQEDAGPISIRLHIAFCILAVFVSGITPFGYDLPVLSLNFPNQLSAITAFWLLLFALLLIASQAISGFRPGYVLLFLILTVQATQWNQTLLLLSVLMPFFLVPLLRVDPVLIRRWRPELIGLSLLLLSAALARYAFEIGYGTASFLPYKMAQYASSRNIVGNTFNSYEFGCYLHWTLSPRQEVLINGRGESLTRVREVRQAANDSRAWKRLLEDQKIESAFLKYNDNLETVTKFNPDGVPITTRVPFSENHFPRSQWALVYWDDNGMIFVRRNGVNNRIVSEEYRSVFPEGASFQEMLVSAGTMNRQTVIRELERKLKEDKYCWRADRMLRNLRRLNPG